MDKKEEDKILEELRKDLVESDLLYPDEVDKFIKELNWICEMVMMRRAHAAAAS